MYTFRHYLPLVLLLLTLFTGCGYHNPNVYTGPDRVIYLSNWKNRTNELGLDARFYQRLYRWFQRSGSIVVSKNRDEARLVLAGEIISLSLPSRSYDGDNTATEVRVSLRVRYVLQDRVTNAILLEQPNEIWTESYLVGRTTSETKANQQEAIATIVDDISEAIYHKSIKALHELE